MKPRIKLWRTQHWKCEGWRGEDYVIGYGLTPSSAYADWKYTKFKQTIITLTPERPYINMPYR